MESAMGEIKSPEEEALAQEVLQRNIQKSGLGNFQRHIFLCTGPKCISVEEGMKSWEALKSGIKERCPDQPQKVARTKVGCLRLCADGPIAVVYPEGTWYKKMDPAACLKVIDQHLIHGRVVEENFITENPLSGKGELK